MNRQLCGAHLIAGLLVLMISLPATANIDPFAGRFLVPSLAFKPAEQPRGPVTRGSVTIVYPMQIEYDGCCDRAQAELDAIDETPARR